MNHTTKPMRRVIYKNGEVKVTGYPIRGNIKKYNDPLVVSASRLCANPPSNFVYSNVNITPINGGLYFIECFGQNYGWISSEEEGNVYGLPKCIVHYLLPLWLRVADKLMLASPEDEEERVRLYSTIKFRYRFRAVQVLNFYAHTLQLFFRSIMESKRRNRVLVIDLLLMKQNNVSYFHNEYALRDIFCYAK